MAIEQKDVSMMANLLTTSNKRLGGISSVDEILLEKGYVKVPKEGPYLEIRFPKRVHSLIDKSMENVVVFRLLGRSIGYKAVPYLEIRFLDRVHSLIDKSIENVVAFRLLGRSIGYKAFEMDPSILEAFKELPNSLFG
ncbi:hypothetical protein Goarm_011423 [Gossypium armourianum]|uniref:Uncharacterized protein n=1 Tax=Gossypium armourianum TaxID=34283 RepID=A0A7J9IWS1_9ROSI|nr:hypothetical protein [Gossypium armourianum]